MSNSNDITPYWQHKPIEELSSEEWESLCDGCGKCCLHKLEDVDTELVYATDVACRLLDLETGRCLNYSERHKLVSDCLSLSPENIKQFDWLPSTCAYRLRARGEPLPDWHPLHTGDADSTRKAGKSICGRACSELQVPIEDLEEHIVVWAE
jgi:uncharacterized cysteine cluster protein YcgN (CxxCxxCC family)